MNEVEKNVPGRFSFRRKENSASLEIREKEEKEKKWKGHERKG